MKKVEPRPRRSISDAEYAAAWNDEDNQGLIQSETLKYARFLHADDRDSCGLQALWRCLQYHQFDHPSKQKFTTSLFRFIHWECRRVFAKQQRRRLKERRLEGDISDLPDTLLPADVYRLNGGTYDETWEGRRQLLRECMSFLPKPVREVVHAHFVESRTVEEIGALHGFSKETARHRLALGIARLKELCSATEEVG